MDGTAVKEIERLAQEAACVETVGDHYYSARSLHPVLPPDLPEPEQLTVHTLSGLAEYVRGGGDDFGDAHQVMLVVEDVLRVRLVGSLIPPNNQRFHFAVATGFPRSNFRFGEFMDVETFIIGLLSQFADDGDRAHVLKIVGNVADERVAKQTDNGFGQNIVVKSSIGVEEVAVPNPVNLAPLRTFPDVAQPVSPFVLRVRKGSAGIQAALFEGDGGAWRVEAIKRIRTWLNGELPDVRIIA